MPNGQGFRYVYVNADGTARELHPNERQYLETEFIPGDGAAPYVKDSYAERNGWGEIRGFLERSKLPGGTPVQDAPKAGPGCAKGGSKPASECGRIRRMAARQGRDDYRKP
jgi:hypothetical protein